MRFILIILALVLTGCGFHLRGLVAIPCEFSDIAIICKDNELDLSPLLKAQLQAYKIEVNPDQCLAKYWLIIENIDFQKQIVSIGSSTNPRQYQLILQVTFSLQERAGEPIIQQKNVVATRQLTVNNDRILGSDDEERIFTNEMKQEAVIQIINRMAAIKLCKSNN